MSAITNVAVYSHDSGCGWQRDFFLLLFLLLLFALLGLGPLRQAALEAYDGKSGRNNGGEPPTGKCSGVGDPKILGRISVTTWYPHLFLPPHRKSFRLRVM
jgi:hypothetical protein